MDIINELSKMDKTTQIIKSVEQSIREAVEPFIGEVNNARNELIFQQNINRIVEEYSIDPDSNSISIKWAHPVNYIEIKIDIT